MNQNKLTEAIEKIGKVSLRGGIFGKTTLALITTVICISAIVLAARNLYLDIAAVILIFIFSAYFLLRLLQFAEKNPLIAILDGAEFVAHERIIQESKYGGVLQSQANAIDHAQPIIDNASIEADDIEEPKKIERQ
ncbi:hypothetical protein [Acetobacter senegalensis]|uniref:hypothetical protein n=1 Tax=Acetobacter senegalensis TaxID=446692 RepID=UPI002650A127|nr:hypothetical protein [Acetobacter senegalensis]MDN7355778.1 hypothetical protein [Acetobacter senegalensis]